MLHSEPMSHPLRRRCAAALLLCLTPLLAVTATSGQAPTLAAHRDRAIDIAIEAAGHPNPFLRANAIEALQPLPERVRPLVSLGVDDRASVVRFAALVTAGKLGFQGAAEAARRRLQDEDANVRAAAIYALHALNKPVDPSPLAGMLASGDPSLRANAVRIVSWMDQPGAIEMIKDATRAPMRRASAEQRMITRVQVAEAVVKLGDEASIDAVRAAAYSPFDEVKVLAILTLGRLEDRAMAAAIAPMLEEGPIEKRLAAAQALGRMGQANGLKVALSAMDHERDPVRAQASFALATMGVPRAHEALVALLDDPSPQVRLSAAAGVIRRTSR